MVEFRPATLAHITDDYIAWLNDRELMRFSRHKYTAHDRRSCERYFASFAGRHDAFLWAVHRYADDLFIGTMTAYLDAHGVADMGILIGHPDARGKGYGLAAWRAAMDHLTATGIRKITGGALAEHRAMVRIFERSGMRHEGTLRGQQLVDGRPADVVLYGWP